MVIQSNTSESQTRYDLKEAVFEDPSHHPISVLLSFSGHGQGAGRELEERW